MPIQDSDTLLWLQAAIPPNAKGRLDRPRAARALGISERTLRRWLAEPERIPLRAHRRLQQLAILRGRGRILWPTPPDDVLAADQSWATYAARGVADIAAGTDLSFWEGGKPDRMPPTPSTSSTPTASPSPKTANP